MDYILTNNGAVMMTQVAAGKTLIFTRAESGSGYSASPAVLQGVIDKKQELFLDEVTYENKQAVVKSVLSNMQLEEEYQLRQIGVYAKLEGDETDTLLLIGQQYNGEKIPTYHDRILQIEYNIAIKASGTGNITIEGVGTGYVTKGQFLAHINDHSNPHKVTAKDVNLEKVPNVGTNDQTPVFEEAEEREDISSGEKLSVLFGKVKKWFTDIKGAAFCSVANNLVTTLAGSVLDARQGKELQDQITGLYSDLGKKGDVLISYSGGNYYAHNGDDVSSKKLLGEIEKAKLIAALANSGLGLTLNSTPDQIYAALASKFPGSLNMLQTAFTRNGLGGSGNTFTLGSNDGNTWYNGFAYSPWYDISAYNTLSISGILKITQHSTFDPAYIHLFLQPENGSGNFTIANLDTAGSIALSSKNISALKGKYRIYLEIRTWNDNCTATINLCTATIN